MSPYSFWMLLGEQRFYRRIRLIDRRLPPISTDAPAKVKHKDAE